MTGYELRTAQELVNILRKEIDAAKNAIWEKVGSNVLNRYLFHLSFIIPQYKKSYHIPCL